MTLPYHPILLQYIPCDCTAHVHACRMAPWWSGRSNFPCRTMRSGRVPLWMAHKLPDILDAYVQSGRVKRMQQVLECAWKLHW